MQADDHWLPIEIWEQVIDHNHNDPDALKACALTCSAFLPVSQLHLFREVVIVRESNGRPRKSGRGRLYSPSKLLSLFDENPHLVHLVKSVALDDRVLETEDAFELSQIFSRLPAITDAAVIFPTASHFSRFQPFSNKLFLELFSLSTITSLDLSPSLFRDSIELNSLLHQCTSLQHFAWHQVDAFQWDRHPRRPGLPPQSLKSLHLSGFQAYPLQPFLQRRAPVNLNNLEELTISIDNSDLDLCVRSIHDLFHIVGSSLTHLTVNGWTASGRYLEFPLDFTELTSLCSLHFIDVTMPPTPLISSIPIPPSLRSLKLEIGCRLHRASDSDMTLSCTVNLVAMGEHIALYASQLVHVAIIVHREHEPNGCSHPYAVPGCEGYEWPDDTDELLEQVMIRMPDMGGKLKVVERTVYPQHGGRRRRDFDRYIIEHGAKRPKQGKEKVKGAVQPFGPAV